MTREEKIDAYHALTDLRKKIEAINGPWFETITALRALDEALGVCLGSDEVFSQCENCDDILFVDDEFSSLEDGGYMCRECLELAKREAGG